MNNEINQVVVELDINKPKDQVWRAMIERISEWWPRDFLGLEGAEKIILETHAGGRLYETSPNGGQLLWGNVVSLVVGSHIEFVGPVTPAFGGPSIWFWKMALEETEGGITKFRLSNSIMGNLSEDSKEEVTQGWNYVFGAFKTFCES